MALIVEVVDLVPREKNKMNEDLTAQDINLTSTIEVTAKDGNLLDPWDTR